MEQQGRPEYAEDERPQNPLRDILTFEKVVRKHYDYQHKRRLVYYIILVGTVFGYIVYASRRVLDGVWETDYALIIPKVLLYRIYVKMLGAIVLVWYVYIRLLRRSSNLTQSMDAQLKLLNMEFDGARIRLCKAKTPKNILKGLGVFRKEERRRKELRWKRFRWYE